MENVKIEMVKDQLTIKIDLKHKGTASASGKSTVIASTKGNIQIKQGTFLGLNVYQK